MMAAEENKALYHRFVGEAVNQGNLETVAELIAPNYVNYNFPSVERRPDSMNPTRGPEGVEELISIFRAAFPDMRMTPEGVFAEGDTVIGRGVWQGTHEGVFQGIPPTNAQVRVSYIDIWRVEDGKFAETWMQMDLLGLMQQVGVVPPHPSTGGAGEQTPSTK
jgi:predicted ester cyclase